MGEPATPTVGTVLRAAAAWLRARGDDEARIDVELLLARSIGCDRAGIYARLNERLQAIERTVFEGLLERHARGEPVAYILGEREFYGLPFVVRTGVLIPRPETELIVEEVLTWVKEGALARPRIVDVGTGSGAVAIALAVNLPEAEVLALDVSPEAVAVARENVTRHRLDGRITVRESDLLDAVDGTWDVVAGNLPYIPSPQVDDLDSGIRDWEPRVALDGGADGLSLHARLLADLPRCLRPGGLVILEVADDCGSAALELFTRALPGATIDLLRDMFDRDRAVRAIMRSDEEAVP